MIDAIYFDGRNARPQAVTLIVHKRVIAMRGTDLRRNERLSRMEISERLEHAPRILRFADGAFIQISDQKFTRLLDKNGFPDPWVVRWQQNWLMSLGALILLLGLLISGYQWGLPWVADKVAQRLPMSVEQKLGDEALTEMDGHLLKPSKLSAQHQARLQAGFAAMKQPRGEKTPYRLEFRDGAIGPNAFALPNGVIVMTDQLVRLAASDHAVLGVLGHELGHVQRRHSLRGFLQTVGVGVVMNIVVGDVSSALAAMPAFLLDQKYSRDFEREADQYAIDMLRVNNMPLTPMAELFEKMERGQTSAAATDDTAAGRDTETANAGAADDEDEEDVAPDTDNTGKKPQGKKGKRETPPEYMSSHPSDAERIARLKAADRK